MESQTRAQLSWPNIYSQKSKDCFPCTSASARPIVFAHDFCMTIALSPQAACVPWFQVLMLRKWRPGVLHAATHSATLADWTTIGCRWSHESSNGRATLHVCQAVFLPAQQKQLQFTLDYFEVQMCTPVFFISPWFCSRLNTQSSRQEPTLPNEVCSSISVAAKTSAIGILHSLVERQIADRNR